MVKHSHVTEAGAALLVCNRVSSRPATSEIESDVFPPLISHSNGTGAASSKTIVDDLTDERLSTLAVSFNRYRIPDVSVRAGSVSEHRSASARTIPAGAVDLHWLSVLSTHMSIPHVKLSESCALTQEDNATTPRTVYGSASLTRCTLAPAMLTSGVRADDSFVSSTEVDEHE
jgi:hypothetical protein